MARRRARKARRCQDYYYYHTERIPLFLLAAYAKGRQSDLTATERAEMRRLATQIVAQYVSKETTAMRRRRHD